MVTPLYLDQILNGAMIIDDELVIHFWNHWLEVHTGLKRCDVIGKKMDDVFEDIKLKLLKRKLKMVFALKAPAFINANTEKYLFKVPSRKIANKYVDYMLQDVVITEYSPEHRQVLCMVYDQTSLLETSHRLQESQLELSEYNEILESIMDFQSNILFVMDNKSIVKWNKNFSELFGADFLERVKNGYTDFIERVSFDFSDSKRREFDDFYEFILGTIDDDSPNRISVSDVDGFLRAFLFSARRMPESEDMVVVSMTDITELHDKERVLSDINIEMSRKFELKNMELKELNSDLVRSRNQLALAQNVAKIGSIEYGSGNSDFFVSDGFSDIIGESGFEPKSIADVYSVFDKGDAAKIKILTENSIKTEKEFIHFASIKNSDRDKLLKVYGKCLEKSGENFRFMMTVHDITDQKMLERQVSDKEQMVSSIFDVTDIGFAILNSGGKVVKVNSKFSEITGYSEEEFVGKELSSLNMEAHRSDFVKYLDKSDNDFEKSFLDKNGERKYVHVSFSKDYSDMDSKYKFISFTDITDNVEAREEQREQEQMLVQQSKLAAMGEMIGVIGHQWKQPLNSLSLILDNIKMDFEEKEFKPETFYEMISICMDQISFMAETIDDFRNFFNVDNSVVEFDCLKMIKSTAYLLESLMKNNGITMTIENCEQDSFMVKGVQNQFKHTILNILTNSKDSILDRNRQVERKRGVVSISLCSEDDYVVVRISDNGMGFDEKNIDNIFEPYFTTKGEKGSGIGMYMAKLIVEKRMGGDISIRNCDEGAMVTIRVPKA